MTEFLEVHVVIQEPSEALRTRRAILRLDLVRSASMIYGANDMYAIDYGDAIRTELLTISWPTFDKLREVLIGKQEPDAPFGDTPMPDVSDMLKPGLHVGALDAEFCDYGKVRQHGDGIITQEIRLSEDPIAILRDLAAKEPMANVRVTDGTYCALCAARFGREGENPWAAVHLPTCPWLRAKNLIEGK